MELQVIKSKNLKQKPDVNHLGFGKYFTDHMFIMQYDKNIGWHDAKIVEYGPVSLEPTALIFHYGQETFEGLKAYKNNSGKITLFRPKDNFARMNRSNERMCMPPVDIDFVHDALVKLVGLEQDWIPEGIGTSLYIRPVMFATEPALGVKISDTYYFIMILSPVGSYYKNGLAPTSIFVEDFYVRASKGGTGEAKCSGNYASGLKPYELAKKEGFAQVLFLDAENKKYIEEVGTSNAFFVIDGTLVTSPLGGTILPGITRNSIIRIAKDNGYKVEERLLPIDEVMEAGKSGALKEAFATGTAAVISPIGSLTYKGDTVIINDNKIGGISQFLYDTLTGIQMGGTADPYGWVEYIN
jgi:branched-chain amino acid aminotransferase